MICTKDCMLSTCMYLFDREGLCQDVGSMKATFDQSGPNVTRHGLRYLPLECTSLSSHRNDRRSMVQRSMSMLLILSFESHSLALCRSVQQPITGVCFLQLLSPRRDHHPSGFPAVQAGVGKKVNILSPNLVYANAFECARAPKTRDSGEVIEYGGLSSADWEFASRLGLIGRMRA